MKAPGTNLMPAAMPINNPRPGGADPHRQCGVHPQGPYLDEQPTSVDSVGFPFPHNTSDLLETDPGRRVDPGDDAHDQIRDARGSPN